VIDPPNNRLAEAMKASGKSRNEVASLIHRTEETVRRLEENRGGPIPSQLVPTLAQFLAVDPAWLMGWDRIGLDANQLALEEAVAGRAGT
jgi:transcriptional regulator with XRE-family HTH domain